MVALAGWGGVKASYRPRRACNRPTSSSSPVTQAMNCDLIRGSSKGLLPKAPCSSQSRQFVLSRPDRERSHVRSHIEKSGHMGSHTKSQPY